MIFKQFTSVNRTTINWAGGTSTEIFIHPSTANFAERNFLFRISTATVEKEETVFSFFKDITRHLMILKGELELIHEGRYTKRLKPFEQDIFSGEWKTRSIGKVTDFNLMLKENATGSLTHYKIDIENYKSFQASGSYYFLYIANGAVIINNEQRVDTGDLLLIETENVISVFTQDGCNLIEIIVSISGAK